MCWACHLLFFLLHVGHGLYLSTSTLYQGSQQQGSILSYEMIVKFYQPSQGKYGNALEWLLAKIIKYPWFLVMHVYITFSTCKILNVAPIRCDFVMCRPGSIMHVISSSGR